MKRSATSRKRSRTCRLSAQPPTWTARWGKRVRTTTTTTTAAGFRNISVHDYDQVDWNIVFSLVTTRLEDFGLLVERVLSHWK
ncbi:MAG: HepT-like ribonuclease domain-containing protein [Spirochaetota bacterium]